MTASDLSWVCIGLASFSGLLCIFDLAGFRLLLGRTVPNERRVLVLTRKGRTIRSWRRGGDTVATD